MFIVFEGLDGSGSTTQAKMLATYLQKQGKSVLHTSEPTDNLVGGLIRGALTRQWSTSAEGLQLLFCADRAHHLKWEIEPSLESGKFVISDRYYWSTVAYGSLKCEEQWLLDMNKHFRKADMTFLLKCDPEVCLDRIEKRGNEKELFEQVETLTKVWKSYERLAEQEPNAVVLDGMKLPDEIGDEVLNILREKFPDNFS